MTQNQIRRGGLTGKIIVVDGTVCSSRIPNNYPMVGGGPFVIDDINGNKLRTRQFTAMENYFAHPIPSGHLRIYMYDYLFTETKFSSRIFSYHTVLTIVSFR